MDDYSKQLEGEIRRLNIAMGVQSDELLASRILAHEWMKKHDKLLGFIQARPKVLKELIDETLANAE